MQRLLRVSSFSISIDRKSSENEGAIATVSLVLESVFDPPRREVH